MKITTSISQSMVYIKSPKIKIWIKQSIPLQLSFYNQTMNVTISVAKTAPYLEIITLKWTKYWK